MATFSTKFFATGPKTRRNGESDEEVSVNANDIKISTRVYYIFSAVLVHVVRKPEKAEKKRNYEMRY